MPSKHQRDKIVADLIQVFDDGTTIGDILRDWLSGRHERTRHAKKEKRRRDRIKAAAQTPAEPPAEEESTVPATDA